MRSGSTFEDARLNCHTRHDDARMKTTDGKQESMLCSKASVKSKSPRQLVGPNVSSVHDLVTFSSFTASVVAYETEDTRAIVGIVLVVELVIHIDSDYLLKQGACRLMTQKRYRCIVVGSSIFAQGGRPGYAGALRSRMRH